MTPITEALEICEKINGTLAIPDNREQEMELGELGAEAFGKLPSPHQSRSSWPPPYAELVIG